MEAGLDITKNLKKKKGLKALMKRKSVRFIALGLVALSGAGLALTMNSEKTVSTYIVSPQLLEDSFFEDGAVRAQERVAISSDYGGRVTALHAREGQTVVQGTLLVELDTADLINERAVLEAERSAVLYSFAQTGEQLLSQIAGLEAQSATYKPEDVSGALVSQIALLERSLDPNSPDSVAFYYMRMIDATHESMSFTDMQIRDGWGKTPAEVQALQLQLDTAQNQSLSISSQSEQYELTRKAQLIEYEKFLNDSATSADDKVKYQELINRLNADTVIDAYSGMRGIAQSQASRLASDLDRARNSIPTEASQLTSRRIALEGELSALEEQYSLYTLNTQTQLLALQAQLESAEAARKTQRQVQGKLKEQADILRDSLGEDSATAGYYAAQVEKLDAAIRDIDRRVEAARIVAPMDCVLGAIDLSVGQHVAPGALITEAVNTGTLQVECMLLTNDANTVDISTPVSIIWERRDGDAEFPAHISQISSLAVNTVSSIGLSEQRVKVLLQPDFPERGYPGDGYQVRLRFAANSKVALCVPRTAILDTDQGEALFILEDGHAVLRHVITGMEAGEYIAIEQGLETDDVVIEDPEGEGVVEGDGIAFRG